MARFFRSFKKRMRMRRRRRSRRLWSRRRIGSRM